ncbi:MAG: homoserine O-acetyltransferase [Bacteroidia bacterium]|nr:homoserine O-acetyltransferase [Bacteroidia bacterium]
MEVYHSTEKLILESGESLAEIELTWQSWGTLNETKDNVIWICHALTGNSDAEDWWPDLIGEGLIFDPARHFIICANMLGSCYGSTGPLSTNPESQKPYFHTFPALSNRDIVQAFDRLRKHLGIVQIEMIIGGSLGGQQVLEWGISHPDLFRHLVPVATNAFHSPWGIAFNESQRMAIAADPSWKEEDPAAGSEGLRAARAIALLSYRSYEIYNRSQEESDLSLTDNYKASSYQQYQGTKLLNRFNAFSYWTLSKAMDSQQLGRGRGGLEKALSRIQAKTLCIGISSDVLFPPQEQRFIAENIPTAEFREINSPYGHDGFLVETAQLATILKDWW